MQQDNNSVQRSGISKFWMRLPLVVRAILIGFSVNTLGVGLWVLIGSTIPPMWAVLTMAIILFLYWRFFSGHWKLVGNQEFRRSCFRDTRLNTKTWLWGLMAGLFLFTFLNVGLVLTFRIVEFQPEVFKTARYFNDMSLWTSIPLIIMASLVAGICEEIGFRGYMQVPLEKKYGPVIGISIVSIIFVVVHLHQAWATGILVQIFVISFMIGYLAYATNSLLPGIITHASFDIINFSYWWSDIAGNFDLKPIGMTGIDTHFILTTVVMLATTVLFILCIRKLLGLKKVSTS